MTGSGIERRMTRLENDRDALYELVDGLRIDVTDFRAEFTEFKTEMTGFQAEFTEFKIEMTGFVGETRGRFDRIEETLAEVVRRLPDPS